MTPDDVLGVILCGGKGSRMGGVDKGLVDFNQRPMASYGIAALAACKHIVINANRNYDIYQTTFNVPVISDENHNYDGPLSGMLAALHYARSQGLTWVITVPCDAPFITSNYVETMVNAGKHSKKKILMACDEFRQPVFALLHVDIINELQAFLRGEQKKILIFYQHIGYDTVSFSDTDMFTNINSIEEKTMRENR